MTNNFIDGICLVNKPSGITSHDVVYKARKIFNTKAIGHTGTLDPLASGLLILTIGKANKLSNYFMDGEKGYEVDFKLGVETDTYDRTGKIFCEKDTAHISEDQVLKLVLELQGTLNLRVPAFSAIKVDGKKLYQLARENKEVPIVEREMSFSNVEILKINLPFVKVRFKCSKGAYVRSWVYEVGQKLGVGATMWELVRFYNAPYDLHHSIALEGSSLEKILESEAYIPLEKTLQDWPRFSVNEKEYRLLKSGCLARSLEKRVLTAIQAQKPTPEGVFVLEPSTERIISFIEVLSPFKVAIKKVFIDQKLDSSRVQE